MPLPTQLLFTFASGLLVALVARAELRGGARAIVRSQPFASYLLYLGLVIVPVSLYFTLFHGDWYLLYLTPMATLSSALVLLGALLEIALGAGGFLLGALLVRHRREPLLGALVGVVTSLAVAAVPWWSGRLAVVGTFAQFHGDYGLTPLGGALLHGIVWMTLWTVLGLCLVAYQLAGRTPK